MSKMLKTTIAAGVFFAAILLVGCATTASTQFYRPANYAGEPYRISGKLEPMEGWNGVARIFINDKEVIKKPLPFFTNTTDASGVFEDKKISTTITRKWAGVELFRADRASLVSQKSQRRLRQRHDACLKRTTTTPPLETRHDPHHPASPHPPLPSPCRRLDSSPGWA
jgi:hypothetical protein